MSTLADYIKMVLESEAQRNEDLIFEAEESPVGESGLTTGNLLVDDVIKALAPVGRIAIGDTMTVIKHEGWRVRARRTTDGLELNLSDNGLRFFQKADDVSEDLVPQNQSKDFKDDVLAKDENGEPHDRIYVDRMKRLAGLK